mmetsp:Transcript_8297/g.16859  ORF Transcript_8297/g.16859 Transcript_8297/m.16859 type:complete len:707 (-) Transcript_8297:922-3042(-)
MSSRLGRRWLWRDASRIRRLLCTGSPSISGDPSKQVSAKQHAWELVTLEEARFVSHGLLERGEVKEYVRVRKQLTTALLRQARRLRGSSGPRGELLAFRSCGIVPVSHPDVDSEAMSPWMRRLEQTSAFISETIAMHLHMAGKDGSQDEHVARSKSIGFLAGTLRWLVVGGGQTLPHIEHACESLGLLDPYRSIDVTGKDLLMIASFFCACGKSTLAEHLLMATNPPGSRNSLLMGGVLSAVFYNLGRFDESKAELSQLEIFWKEERSKFLSDSPSKDWRLLTNSYAIGQTASLMMQTREGTVRISTTGWIQHPEVFRRLLVPRYLVELVYASILKRSGSLDANEWLSRLRDAGFAKGMKLDRNRSLRAMEHPDFPEIIRLCENSDTKGLAAYILATLLLKLPDAHVRELTIAPTFPDLALRAFEKMDSDLQSDFFFAVVKTMDAKGASISSAFLSAGIQLFKRLKHLDEAFEVYQYKLANGHSVLASDCAAVVELSLDRDTDSAALGDASGRGHPTLAAALLEDFFERSGASMDPKLLSLAIRVRWRLGHTSDVLASIDQLRSAGLTLDIGVYEELFRSLQLDFSEMLKHWRLLYEDLQRTLASRKDFISSRGHSILTSMFHVGVRERRLEEVCQVMEEVLAPPIGFPMSSPLQARICSAFSKLDRDDLAQRVRVAAGPAVTTAKFDSPFNDEVSQATTHPRVDF